MDQGVRLDHLFEGGAEGGHQHVGQVLDEADRVRDQGHLAIGQHQAPRGGVQGGEEPVLGEHRGPGQGVEEGGLARVGVADQGELRQGDPPLTQARAVPPQRLDLALELGDPRADPAAVAFELGLARAPGADAAAQA
ncbi:hypothetical protein D3C86_1744420 [compost metagenome]